MITDADRTQLRETAERLLSNAELIEKTDDPELLDLAADICHLSGWVIEGVADRARIAGLARTTPEKFATALIGLDVDELENLGLLLLEEAHKNRGGDAPR
jgi:hypothetical protein